VRRIDFDCERPACELGIEFVGADHCFEHRTVPRRPDPDSPPVAGGPVRYDPVLSRSRLNPDSAGNRGCLANARGREAL
jgi:hypothetical protein